MSRLLFAVLFLAVPSFASTTCQTTINAHNGSQISFCITENGNIINLEGPVGLPQIQGGEGYGICFPGQGEYWDLGVYGDSGNWHLSTISQPKGPNTLPMTITRSTADDKYTLIQTFKLVGAGKSVGVTMTMFGANLVRYAEIVPMRPPQDGGRTAGAAFVWSDNLSGFFAKPTYTPMFKSAEIVAGGINNPCVPAGGNSNLATLLTWGGSTLKTRTMYFEYTPTH